MKKTALTSKHIDLGAKMVEFAGYYMPIQYTGVNEEHETVREAVGVFDVSHMGEFEVKGPEALKLLQKISSNDVSKLEIGQAQYGCLPNGKGGIVDDFLTYRLGENEYFCVVNASNIEKDWDWFNKQNSFDCELHNASYNYALLAVQGPKTIDALQSLTDINLSEIPYYRFKIGTFAGIENVMISATGYTGSGGFELYIHNEDAQKLWDSVMAAGEEYGIKPIGLAARDTLRLEMGFCLYGNDIDDSTSPLEAGLGWITKLGKEDFIDKEFLQKQKETGIQKKLIAFEMEDRGIPRHGYEVTDGNGNKIGEVTSGTMGPSVKKAIGLAYVKSEFAGLDNTIFIAVRNKELKAKAVKLPFYKKA